jgi:hypothetical protein
MSSQRQFLRQRKSSSIAARNWRETKGTGIPDVSYPIVQSIDLGHCLRYTTDMNARIDKIVAEALGLPAPLRAFIAAKLLESLDVDGDQELSPEWKEEIRKRCKEIDEGAVHLVEADDAFAKAYSKLS